MGFEPFHPDEVINFTIWRTYRDNNIWYVSAFESVLYTYAFVLVCASVWLGDLSWSCQEFNFRYLWIRKVLLLYLCVYSTSE